MDTLMKKGWTLEMINRVIRNCNKAFGMKVALVQKVRYEDELDTDEELGPLPRSVNSKRKWDEGDENDDEWDPDASIDTVSKGQKPYKKPQKDPCPSKQPYHGYKKTGKGKTSTTEASVVSTTVPEETRYVTGGANTQVGLQARIMTFPKRGGGAG